MYILCRKLPAILVTGIAFILMLSGCGKEEVPPPNTASTAVIAGTEPLPDGHPPVPEAPTTAPHAMQTVPGGIASNVVMPDSVTEKWEAVRLVVLHAGGEEQELKIAIGGEVALAGSDLVVAVPVFLPAYMSDSDRITSVSDDLNNPAIWAELRQGGGIVVSGWVFKNFPEFNTFGSETVELRLVDAEKR